MYDYINNLGEKSVILGNRKDPKGLSNHIVAFANADGGVLVVGIEDDLKITGIDDYTENVNEIMRVPFDYCKPSVKVNFSTVECTDFKGKPNHVLVMEIPQCKQVHANQQDD
ncbi:MAG: ATP-binding protein, partial [Erysipelotrichaceae bacterium]|nr:ATP-binding protein [Erysipelotrichaceae bacterium]